MRKIVLIACVSKKATSKQTAENLYLSSLFKKELRYAKEMIQPDQIFILSAKHGLVGLHEELEPYDVTLNKMKAKDRAVWAEGVLAKLKQSADLDHDQFIFLAGEKYRENLLPYLTHVEVPMLGLKIGQQLEWLTHKLEQSL